MAHEIGVTDPGAVPGASTKFFAAVATGSFPAAIAAGVMGAN